MLPKKYRLAAKDFRYVYSNGVKFRGKYGMLVASSSNRTKFGFVVSKKVGNAVQRHRMTRLLRVISMELVKQYTLDGIKLNFEYIAFLFCDNYSELKSELELQLKSAIKR